MLKPSTRRRTASSRRSTAGSRASPRATPTASPGCSAAARSPACCSLGMVAVDRAPVAHRRPARLVPDEDQGFYISAVILPDGATLERTAQGRRARSSRRSARTRTTSTSSRSPASTSSAAASATTPATIFVTQKHWDERDVTAAQLVGELFGKTMGIKEALVLAFNPPAIFGLGTTGGYEFYIQNRGDGGAEAARRGEERVPAAREQRPAARRRADAVARQRAAAVGRRRPREGEDARRADRRRLQRARRRRSATSTSTTSTSTAARGRC